MVEKPELENEILNIKQGEDPLLVIAEEAYGIYRGEKKTADGEEVNPRTIFCSTVSHILPTLPAKSPEALVLQSALAGNTEPLVLHIATQIRKAAYLANVPWDERYSNKVETRLKQLTAVLNFVDTNPEQIYVFGGVLYKELHLLIRGKTPPNRDLARLTPFAA